LPLLRPPDWTDVGPDIRRGLASKLVLVVLQTRVSGAPLRPVDAACGIERVELFEKGLDLLEARLKSKP